MLSWSVLTEERGKSWTDSDKVNTKDWMRLQVVEERNNSWSLGERILREGVWNDKADGVSGGGGRAGVSGRGRGLEAGVRRRRGSSFGIWAFDAGAPRLSTAGDGLEIGSDGEEDIIAGDVWTNLVVFEGCEK